MGGRAGGVGRVRATEKCSSMVLQVGPEAVAPSSIRKRFRCGDASPQISFGGIGGQALPA